MRVTAGVLTGLLALAVWVAAASAQTSVELSTNVLCVGDRLLVHVRSDREKLSYRLMLDDEQLGTGAAVTAREAAFCPDRAGQYRLTVAEEGGSDSPTVTFTVYDEPRLSLNVDQTHMQAGETMAVSAVVTGGAPQLLFRWSVWSGTECLYTIEGAEPDLTYVPFREGEYYCAVTVTDGLSHSVSAVSPVISVTGTGGIQVRGDMTRLPVQGGVRTFVIDSPGAWSAETDADFITLYDTCGGSGDSLSLYMGASNVGRRSGTVVLKSAGLQKRLLISQIEDITEEEEEYLLGEPRSSLLPDGQRTVEVRLPSGGGQHMIKMDQVFGWTAESDEAFLTAQRNGDTLTLTAERNPGTLPRSAGVILRSGDMSAAVLVVQDGAARGADVREVLLSGDTGTAYQDMITATVRTDGDAESLTLTIGTGSVTSFDRAQASAAADGLVWRIQVPLTGSGVQEWLFSAGSGKKALARINVTGERPRFAQSAASVKTDGDALTAEVLTTQGTDRIEAIDEEGNVLTVFTPGTARVDRYLNEANAGRYARWVLALTGAETPARLRIGDETVPVLLKADTASSVQADEGGEPFVLYSQMDGTWRHKAYRKSNLEHSGCAIFTLSHALQLLGYRGDAILPERLAVTYAFCLVDGGTLNSTLVGNAGDEFGFKTRYKLYDKREEILRKFSQGAVFSFSIASGHIALTDRVSEDGRMCHIIDSAPSATFERIKGATPCLFNEKTGAYEPLAAPSDIPGVLYYIDTEGYDGAEYWLPTDYVVKRGVRLIQR